MPDMAKRGPKGPMTPQHKEALATGRIEGKAVRDYLEALRANKPKRGRKRTPQTMQKRLDDIEVELVDAEPVRRLLLVQERIDLVAELAAAGSRVDLGMLEANFVKVAKSYGARNGLSYAAWRSVGVDASVLKAAGIPRSQ